MSLFYRERLYGDFFIIAADRDGPLGYLHVVLQYVDTVRVVKTHLHKGIGKKMYIAAAWKLYEMRKRLLESDNLGVTSDSAKRVWRSLVKDGLADSAKVPPHLVERWRFRPDFTLRIRKPHVEEASMALVIEAGGMFPQVELDDE